MATGADKYWVLGLPVLSIGGNPEVKYWVNGLPVLLVDGIAPLSIEVPAGSLAFTTYAPILNVGVPTASLAFTTYAPSISGVIDVPAGSLTLTTFAPGLTLVIEVPAGSLSLATFAPDASTGIVIPVGSLALATFAPAITLDIEVPTASMAFSTFAPVPIFIIEVPTTSLAFTTYAPIVSDIGIQIPTGSMAFTTYAPSIIGNSTIEIPTGSLVLATYAPTIFQGDISPCSERFGPKIYFWEPSYLDRPEDTFLRATDWDECGYPGLKFVQGLIIEADTEGQTREVKIQGDQLDVETLTINHNGQLEKPYSLNQPVQKHLLRLLPVDTSVFWRLFNVRWIYEPAPEFAKEWKTQGTDHDLPGFQFLKDGYIAHASTADITLNITVDGTVFTYTIPNSGGVYVKTYIIFGIKPTGQTLKGTLYTYELTSTEPFQLYQKDCEVRVHDWSGGEYVVKQPFGDISRVTGARI